MKVMCAFVLCFLIHDPVVAQLFDYNFNKINAKSKRHSRHILARCTNTFTAHHVDYTTVASFVLSGKATQYDSGKNIIDFLSLNKQATTDEFFTSRDGEFTGEMSFFDQVYFNEKVECSYQDQPIYKQHYAWYVAYCLYNELKKHQYSLLFAVKGFNDAIWFVEDEKVFILDVTSLYVYDPDEYIKLKCSQMSSGTWLREKHQDGAAEVEWAESIKLNLRNPKRLFRLITICITFGAVMLAQTLIQNPEIITKSAISLEITLSKGRFQVIVGSQVFQQTMCEFMLTFASMQGKDMHEYMSNLTSEYDFVSVPLSGSGKSVKLALSDFARLRSLYSQQMFELKLEDLLLRQGITATRASHAS